MDAFSRADACPTTRRAPRRLGVRGTVLAAALVVIAAVACVPAPPRERQVADPTPRQVVAESHGAAAQPTRVDVPYVAGARRGCGAGAVSHERCGGSQTLDVLPATAGTPRGVIVFVHGGGFMYGDKSNRGQIGFLAAQRARGWSLVSVNYRLADTARTVQFREILADVAAAVTWVRANASTVGVDASRVVLAGHSAGATIAALAALAANSPHPVHVGLPRVDGWVSMAGILQSNLGAHATAISRVWVADPEGSARLVSPTMQLDAADPPGWVIHGVDDSMVEIAGSYQMANVAAEANLASKVHIDVVDVFADGTALPPSRRNHSPAGGVNAAAFAAFLDTIKAPTTPTTTTPMTAAPPTTVVAAPGEGPPAG